MGIHRICRRCGKKWNVSCIDPGPKVYICPVCDLAERLRNKKERETRNCMNKPGSASDSGLDRW